MKVCRNPLNVYVRFCIIALYLSFDLLWNSKLAPVILRDLLSQFILSTGGPWLNHFQVQIEPHRYHAGTQSFRASTEKGELSNERSISRSVANARRLPQTEDAVSVIFRVIGLGTIYFVFDENYNKHGGERDCALL